MSSNIQELDVRLGGGAERSGSTASAGSKMLPGVLLNVITFVAGAAVAGVFLTVRARKHHENDPLFTPF